MPVLTPAITSLSATEVTSLIRQKQLSPVEVVEAYLQRIEEVNPAVNAFACINAEQARVKARQAELTTMQGEHSKPLLGVPVTIKSCIDVQDMLCEAGSRLRSGYVAQEDAPLVKRLKDAGAIVIGNTTVPEMLLAYHTENELHGRTNNPWALDRTPGGSSGGEAAAIAAGMSAGGIGSDGGGSIRVPAHFSGICGLKPTPGRIPGTGHQPPCLGPFSLIGVVGPMARTVGDLDALFRAIAGWEPGDPMAVPLPAAPIDRARAPIRIGYFEDDGRVPVTAETRGAVRAAAKALAEAGHEVEAFTPSGLERARELWEIFFCEAALMVLAAPLDGAERRLPILEAFLARGPRPPRTTLGFIEAWIDRDQMRADLLRQMETFRVLLCPVASVPAFRHGERAWTIDGVSVEYLEAMSYTVWFNILGNPAAVVPVERSPEGLPIGVQVVGRPFEEELVLQIAASIER